MLSLYLWGLLRCQQCGDSSLDGWFRLMEYWIYGWKEQQFESVTHGTWLGCGRCNDAFMSACIQQDLLSVIVARHIKGTAAADEAAFVCRITLDDPR
jgi:hypothetical protein